MRPRRCGTGAGGKWGTGILKRHDESCWCVSWRSFPVCVHPDHILHGHLMPGNEDEAVALVDSYLERAATQSRVASVEPAPLTASYRQAR
jgi:hypothetical protein